MQQSSSLADGSRAYKTRPIDDFSESLVNSTSSCEECIQTMGIDMILAALELRHSWGSRKAGRQGHRPEEGLQKPSLVTGGTQ